MTIQEFIDFVEDNSIDKELPMFLEEGYEVFLPASHCVADATGIIIYPDSEEINS